jgi:hypothetical protein
MHLPYHCDSQQGLLVCLPFHPVGASGRSTLLSAIAFLNKPARHAAGSCLYYMLYVKAEERLPLHLLFFSR